MINDLYKCSYLIEPTSFLHSLLPWYLTWLRGRRHHIDREPLQGVCIVGIGNVYGHDVRSVDCHLEWVVVVVHDRLRVEKARVDQWVVLLRLSRQFVTQTVSMAEFMAEGVDHGLAVRKQWRGDVPHARPGRAIGEEGCGWGHVARSATRLHGGKEGVLINKHTLQLHGSKAPCLRGHLEAGCDVLAIGFGLEPIQVDKTTEGGVDWIARDAAIESQLGRCRAGRHMALCNAVARRVIVAPRQVR